MFENRSGERHKNQSQLKLVIATIISFTSLFNSSRLEAQQPIDYPEGYKKHEIPISTLDTSRIKQEIANKICLINASSSGIIQYDSINNTLIIKNPQKRNNLF
jgi:hypothetical protein